MELFSVSINENTNKRRKWGPIRSDTDVGYERLPNLLPKEECKIRLVHIKHIHLFNFLLNYN